MVGGLAGACGSHGSSQHDAAPPIDGAPAEAKVDVLFMVDDSPSMLPKQQALIAAFPAFANALDALASGGKPASYHIGVVTSDLGSDANGSGGCTPGGLGARLQPLGRAHGATCVAPTGANFVQLDLGTGTDNLPAGQDLATTFTCMASVGTAGCGFEHQLESVYQALHDCMPAADGTYPGCTIPENTGFLRPDSLLVVALLTDEDDCSAPPDTNLFEQAMTSTYGFDGSYRCSNYGVACGGQLLPYGASGGPLSDCAAAPNPNGAGPGKLYDVSRYITFFGQPSTAGGVRADPANVILAEIDAPATPVQTVTGDSDIADMAQPGGYAACPQGSQVGTPSCTVLLGHSCFPTAELFGDPAVRIHQVVTSVHAQAPSSSICDADYSPALTSLADAIGARIGTQP